MTSEHPNSGAISGNRPGSCDVAFKEWASVILALERGKQGVLLRKGGMDEEDGAFRIAYPRFLLFPTYEHQDPRLVKPQFASLISESVHSQDDKGRIPISSFAEIQADYQTERREQAYGLLDQLIWNERYLDSRFTFQPERPLHVMLVRVYRLPNPTLVEFKSEYAGCRSWVTFDSPLSLEGAVPALSDIVFGSLQKKLRQLFVEQE